MSATTFAGEMRFLKYQRSKVLKLPLNRWQTSKFKQPDKRTNGIVEQVTYWELFIFVDKSLLVLPSTIYKSYFSHAKSLKMNHLITEEDVIWKSLY